MTAKSNPKSEANEPTEPPKSTSPFASFYEIWNELGKIDATTPEGLLSIVKRLAQLSRREFFHSPIPLPGPAETELRKLLAQEVTTPEEDEGIELRRKILRQFKFYLRNQAMNRRKVHDTAYQQWCEALQCLEGEVAWACRGKMCQTTYRQTTIDAIFNFATKACGSTWANHRLKASSPDSQESRRRRHLEDAKTRFAGRPELLKAYEDSINCKSIEYSPYARKLKVSCNQQKESFSMIGLDRPLHISREALFVWTVIRRLVSSKAKDGIVELYDKWWGSFAESSEANKDIATLRKYCIRSAKRPLGAKHPHVHLEKPNFS